MDTTISEVTKQAIANALTAELEVGGVVALVVNENMKQYTPEEFIAGFDYFVYKYGDLLASAILVIGDTNLYTFSEGSVTNYSLGFYIRLSDTITSSINGGYYVPIYVQEGIVGNESVRVNANGIALSTALWTKTTANISTSDADKIKNGLALTTELQAVNRNVIKASKLIPASENIYIYIRISDGKD